LPPSAEPGSRIDGPRGETDALVAHQEAQNVRLDDALARIRDLREVLVEGFRLERRG